MGAYLRYESLVDNNVCKLGAYSRSAYSRGRFIEALRYQFTVTAQLRKMDVFERYIFDTNVHVLYI